MTSQMEELVAELRAIEFWDSDYYRERPHHRITIAAFEARQIRRREIISKLFRIKSRLSDAENGGIS